MREKTRPTWGLWILIITVVAQLALSLKYFLSKDLLGGFITLATAIIWAIAASKLTR